MSDTATREHIDIMVCIDCYFGHHYGAHEYNGQWFAGDSDTPADRPPLTLIEPDWVVTDNTDSETGEGIYTFSSTDCQGCGSTLGGQRFRLMLHT